MKVEASKEDDSAALAFRVLEIDPEAIERHFFLVDDVLVFGHKEAREIAAGSVSAEEVLARVGRKACRVSLWRDKARIVLQPERGVAGLLLAPAELPEEADSTEVPPAELRWADIFRDEQRFYPLQAAAKSFLALSFPVIYLMLAGAWRQLAMVICFYAVAALVSPLFLVLTYGLLGYAFYASGPELVAADYRYYERKIWGRIGAATPELLRGWTDGLLLKRTAAPDRQAAAAG